MALEGEIRETLLEFDMKVRQEEVEKMEDIARMFSYDADTIVNEWIAFQSSHGHCDLDLTNLDHFKHERLHAKNKINSHVHKTPLRPLNVYTAENIHAIFSPTEDVDMLIDAYATPGKKAQIKSSYTKNNSTPISKIHTSSMMDSSMFSPSATPSTSYSSRSNAGETVTSFGSYNGDNHSGNVDLNLVRVDVKNNRRSSNKYMFQKLCEIKEVIDASIQYMAEVLQEKYKEEITHFCSLVKPGQEPVNVIGQICSKEGGVGKLTNQTLMIMGDRFISNGRTVELDVSKLEDYAFFPGQVVALRGINPTGTKFIADKLYDGVMLQKRNKDPKFGCGLKDTLEVCVAAGPFTTSDSLSYEPIRDLVNKIKTDKPDLTILIGPLVDCQHSDIKNFKIDESFENIQEKQFQFFKDNIESITQVLFLPSQRDICCHPVYPQLPYTTMQSSKSFHFCGDPCVVEVNGVQIAVTSSDVLLHLSSEEVSRSSVKRDRLARLAKHLLVQHSMYPLYPSHESMNIDLPQAERLINLQSTPDILILPSNLKTFITDLDGCVCVNPGRLAKGGAGGTYSRLQIKDVFSDQINISGEIIKI